LGEAEQESEGVTVGGDGVRADSSLVDQTLGEERFEDGRQRCHTGSRSEDSSRVAAACSRSGCADRYQYVDAGLMWPR